MSFSLNFDIFLKKFTQEDKIDLYKIPGQSNPKEEELPNEMITKKFNSTLSLKPLKMEMFDDETVVAKLLKEGKGK